MLIEPNDLDYKLIAQAERAKDEVSKDWVELERVFRNVVNEKFQQKAKKLNRSYIQTPIVRDTVLIKRSIFTTSFQINDFPISIERVGDEESKEARQLRIAVKYFWKLSNPFVELNKAMLRMLVFPVGIVMQYWNASKGKIVIEECNPMDISFDPEARNSEDVQFLTYKYKKTARDIKAIIDADKERKKKKKFYNKLEGGFFEFFKFEYDVNRFEPFKRYELKEIYIKQSDGGWLCKTYYPSGGLLLRETKFKECPFQWGFAREQLSSVDKEVRAKQIMAYGESEVDYIKEHAQAMNKRRNQHSDIVEEQINPSTYVGADAKVNPSHLKRGPGAKIPVGDVSQVRERRAPTTMGLHDDLAMHKEDIETTSSVNGLYKAQTSGSDRRATGALALLSNQSSTRIEEQIMTANDTLFSHVAKNFVKKVYRYVDSKTLLKLGIEKPLIGRDVASLEEFDFVVNVKFGSNTKRQDEYASYMEAVAVLGQHQNVNPQKVEGLVERALQIKLGDEFKIDGDWFVNAEPNTSVPEDVQKGSEGSVVNGGVPNGNVAGGIPGEI